MCVGLVVCMCTECSGLYVCALSSLYVYGLQWPVCVCTLSGLYVCGLQWPVCLWDALA